MLLRKWSKALGTMIVVFAAPAVLAASSVKLDCPAGTVQKGGNNAKQDIVACVKQGAGFKPHGPTVYFHQNGTKEAEGQSEEGFRTGLWTFYDPSGNKTGTAMFKRSNFHGEVVELHSNGKVRKVEQYVDGLREGTAKEFSADGKLVKQTEYSKNRVTASK